MKYLWLTAVLLPLLLLPGCSEGSEDSKVDTEDPAFYADKVKTQVNELIDAVGNSPKRAAEEGAVLLEELEVYETQPVGSHGDTYAQLLEKCKELVAAGKDGSGAKVSAALNDMKALADKLPAKKKEE